MQAVASCGMVGASVPKLRLTYQRAIADEAMQERAFEGLSGFRVTTSIGGDFAPKAIAEGVAAAPGNMVFFDSSTYLAGYASDTGRTFMLGEPTPLMRRVMDALRSGVEEALSIARPGLAFSELFTRTQETIRRNGLPSYTRGHLGHTIGITHVALEEEQPPFVGPKETAVLEPGMVLCYETPYYVHGLGGFQLEEVLEVTVDGVRRMTALPLDFWRIPA
jgi:Xaa-Pro aminopeptidase